MNKTFSKILLATIVYTLSQNIAQASLPAHVSATCTEVGESRGLKIRIEGGPYDWGANVRLSIDTGATEVPIESEFLTANVPLPSVSEIQIYKGSSTNPKAQFKLKVTGISPTVAVGELSAYVVIENKWMSLNKEMECSSNEAMTEMFHYPPECESDNQCPLGKRCHIAWCVDPI